MITYRATLDVPAETVRQVAGRLAAHRKIHDARPWQRAATPFVQAVVVLRRFREATDLRILAADARVSIATRYRYLHEAIDVIAAHAPDLHDVLAQAVHGQWAFVGLDGTLIPSTRCGAPCEAGHDLWYSGKHKPTAGTSKYAPTPAGIRPGSAPSNPAPPTTSPRPAATFCPPATRPQPQDCPP